MSGERRQNVTDFSEEDDSCCAAFIRKVKAFAGRYEHQLLLLAASEITLRRVDLNYYQSKKEEPDNVTLIYVSVILIVNYLPLAMWQRLYKLEGYKMTLRLALIAGAICLGGFLVHLAIMYVPPYGPAYWEALAVLSLAPVFVLATIIIFSTPRSETITNHIGHWFKNDYCFYEPPPISLPIPVTQPSRPLDGLDTSTRPLDTAATVESATLYERFVDYISSYIPQKPTDTLISSNRGKEIVRSVHAGVLHVRHGRESTVYEERDHSGHIHDIQLVLRPDLQHPGRRRLHAQILHRTSSPHTNDR